MNYDIIGDIHGEASKLIALLDSLGYIKQQGVYQQENHQAVFVGDFIDRGEQQMEVINIVRPMIDTGKALAVMGNHEFNAICYHTQELGNDKQFLRQHNEKNNGQHEAFLKEYPLGLTETNELINWFKTLPLFIELEDKFRVIHACWDDEIIEDIKTKGYINNDNSLKGELFPLAAKEGHAIYDALEVLLKGKEIKLPSGEFFHDKDGNKRHEIRIKWWKKNLKNYHQASVLEIDSLKAHNDTPLPDSAKKLGYSENDIPVFFGHYWFTGEVQPLSHNVACVDFSAAKEGPLVAYRWNDKSELQGRYFLESDFVEQDHYKEFTDADVINTHKHSDDKSEIERSNLCGCFYCLTIFEPVEIDNFEQGVWCPRCGIDSVIGDKSGYPVTGHFLTAMNKYWF